MLSMTGPLKEEQQLLIHLVLAMQCHRQGGMVVQVEFYLEIPHYERSKELFPGDTHLKDRPATLLGKDWEAANWQYGVSLAWGTQACIPL